MWGDEYWSVARVAAASQLLSCRGALKYITAVLLQSTSEINGPERWGEVITLTRCFSAISTLADCGGNRSTLKHSVHLKRRWGEHMTGTICLFLPRRTKKKNVTWHFIHVVHWVQTNDIRTSNHAASIQSYPAQTAHLPCQTTRGQRGWGSRDHWPAAITQALRRL